MLLVFLHAINFVNMKTFKKALTGCAIIALGVALCFTILPSSVVAGGGSGAGPSIGGDDLTCITSPEDNCYSAAVCEILMHYKYGIE